MKVVVALAAASIVGIGLVACKKPEMFPIGGGGGGGTGGMHNVDASIDGSGDGGTADERVCLALDPRQLSACAPSGAGGFTVTLGTQTATTAADGTFALTPPMGIATWQVTGTAIVPSLMPFVATRVIPALTQTTFADLALANGVILVPGQGSLFVRVTRAGVPLAGAVVSASPAASYATYYDGNSATTWNQNSTGAFGVAWIAGANVGTTSVVVTPAGGTAHTTAGLPVGDNALTFITIDAP